MNDQEFAEVWSTLDPTALQRRRIDTRVVAWLEARDVSIAGEWFALFRIAPLSATGLVAVSAVAVAIVTAAPLLWIARALM